MREEMPFIDSRARHVRRSLVVASFVASCSALSPAYAEVFSARLQQLPAAFQRSSTPHLLARGNQPEAIGRSAGARLHLLQRPGLVGNTRGAAASGAVHDVHNGVDIFYASISDAWRAHPYAAPVEAHFEGALVTFTRASG